MIHDRFDPATLINGRAIELEAIPIFALDQLEGAVLGAVAAGQRVAAMFGAATPGSGAIQLYVVLADDEQNRLHVARTQVEGDQFPSLTPRCPQVHLFEREIAEQFGLKPLGHPWLKPVRYHRSPAGRDVWNRSRDQSILPAVGDFYRVEGDEVHEVAVGPVHAGVIEPGHFRFQCHGEHVFHLEIALGYQHRGVEEAMVGGPTKRSIHYAQTLAGDTTIAHTTAYCQVLEALARCQKTARAQSLRGIALELERMANHVGDLGALANDVGFLPTASYCGRIRGDFLNMTALLCGSRFGRGMVRPGGVGFDVDDTRVAELLRRLDAAEKDTTVAVNLLWDTSSVMARFEDIGPLPQEVAVELGIVGPAARASGLARDVRQDQSSSIFQFAHIPIATYDTGDVLARAYVRWFEIQQSIKFIREQLRGIPPGAVQVPLGPLAPERLAVTLSEGWRGEVCHVAITDAQGHFARYKVVDPSFHNWSGLAYALRNQQISDFPLCNKSFNLSYCGHDL
ncbi:MAG: NADH-quinone oxidoreductase subunit C [Candidatus Latescibacteria bacterium]|nr:NADH-quinone oxidoreductase subunit C [Candidatus Latescibacterota bacterium]